VIQQGVGFLHCPYKYEGSQLFISELIIVYEMSKKITTCIVHIYYTLMYYIHIDIYCQMDFTRFDLFLQFMITLLLMLLLLLWLPATECLVVSLVLGRDIHKPVCH